MSKFVLSLLIMLSSVLVEAKTLKLNSDNTLVITGEVLNNFSADNIKKLEELVKKRGDKQYDLFLLLLSEGGSFVESDIFITYAQSVKNLHTITLASISAASHIVQQIPGKRFIVEDGYILMHNAKYSPESPRALSISDINLIKKILEKVIDQQAGKNSQRIGLSKKEYLKKIENDWEVMGEDAISSNMADEIVNLDCGVSTNEAIPVDFDTLKWAKKYVVKYFNCLQIGVQK